MTTKPNRYLAPGALFVLVFALLATLGLRAQETQRVYLSGRGTDDAVAWKFKLQTAEKEGAWTTLPVPSNWEMHGFGSLNYRRDPVPAQSEVGHYERDFDAPADWKGKRVFVVFEGSATDTTVTINGKSTGPTHQGAYYRFKYEITSLLNYGASNKLEVAVAKHSANKSVNKAERDGDFWIFGGIFRPVYLEVQPQQFIDRVAIDARADGSFYADVFLNGAIGDNADAEAQVLTIDGKKFGPKFSARITGGKATLRVKINNPKLWTAETPNLYRVQFSLKQKGKIAHTLAERFGFRTFEVRDEDGLYLNGQRVILKGANRHSFWPESGRALNEKIHRMDIEVLKDANMNAVRMAHYPPDAEFLDLCDKLGLYVLNELAGWHAFYDDEVGTKLVEEMVTHDVNHPSILFWCNGNEGGFNFNLDDIYGKFDPQQRRVLHPWTTFGGINTTHYLTYDLAAGAASGIYVSSSLKDSAIGYHTYEYENPKKYIYMPTEFLHGLFDGGAGAALADYWKLMSASKYLGGGFIWALVDEGVKRPDTGEIDTSTKEAPDGILGPYREREGSFYTIKEIWSPIEIYRDADGTFVVKNHYSFINTDACTFTWQLLRYPAPSAAGSATVLKEIPARGANIAPGQTGRWKIDMPADTLKHADAISLRVNDHEGRELWTWVWPLESAARFAKIPQTPARAATAQAKETDNVIEVTSGGLKVTISKQTGLLAAVERDGKPYTLANGPLYTGETGKLEKISVTADGEDQVIAATYEGAFKTLTWRVRANGWVDCDYSYTVDKEKKEYVGVTFDYPEANVKAKRWLGDGPYHVYKNRVRGVTLGVWENAYNNTITGYRDWIYPEFKGFFANVRWLQLTTTEGPITCVPTKGIRYIQVLKQEYPPENIAGTAIIPMPDCGLGFMQAIPPIGSSTKPVKDIGLQSQLNAVPGPFTGSVSFYFGQLPDLPQ